MKQFLVSGERASLVVGVFVGLSLSFLVVRELSRASSLFINETIECVFSGASVDNKTNEPELEAQNRIVPGVLALSFSPNNKSLAVANYRHEGGVSLMKVSDKSSQKLTNKATTAAAFSPDGKWIAHSNGLSDPLGIIEVSSGKNRTLGSPTTSKIYSVAYAPNNKWITTGHENGSVYLWSTADDKVRLLGRSNTGDTDTAVFSPDSRFVASGGDDLLVHLWDVETGLERVLGSHPKSNEIFGLSFSPDGKLVASVASNDTNSPCLWDVKTAKGQCFGNDRKLGNPYAVAFAPDGKSFLVGWSIGELISYNVKDGKSTSLLNPLQAIYAIAFSSDGKLFATGGPSIVRLYDAKTGKELPANSPSTEIQDTAW